MIYGHPFETVNAAVEEKALKDFFSGDWTPEQMQSFLEQRGIGYIYYGPRERISGRAVDALALRAVFQSGEVTIYQTGGTP